MTRSQHRTVPGSTGLRITSRRTPAGVVAFRTLNEEWITTLFSLYESVGFTHMRAAEIGPVPYVRADDFMRLALSLRRLAL